MHKEVYGFQLDVLVLKKTNLPKLVLILSFVNFKGPEMYFRKIPQNSFHVKTLLTGDLNRYRIFLIFIQSWKGKFWDVVAQNCTDRIIIGKRQHFVTH